MKFLCLQENLKEGLTICERITGKNTTLPILNNILIEDDGGRIRISSTDLEIGINFWFSGKIIEKGSIACPAKILSSFINSLPGQKIEIETKNNTLYIKNETGHSSIPGIGTEDFPIIPKLKTKDFIEISSLVFKNALGQVINSVAAVETRPEISGIFFKIDSEGLKLVATDSFRLSEKKISPKYFKMEKFHSLIFPQKVGQEIIRIIGDIDKPLKIFIDSNQILFDLENIQLISRLIEGQYPDYQAIIPQKISTQIDVLKDELINAIKIAGIFSSKINDVKMKVQKSTLEIESRSELGSNHSQITAKISGSETEIVFNYRYLLDGLNNISEKEVVLGLNSETSPAVLKPADDQNYLYVVMPIRSN
ncbi:MAG: DNA polymerase III subunit beta [bacterium]|nr:DNA polymerase III subunit beta [bacterium]